MTEQPGVWIPSTLVDLDSAVMAPLPSSGELTKKPSEYFKTNVFVAASFVAPFEVEAAVGDWWWTNLMWAGTTHILKALGAIAKTSMRRR